MITLRPRLFVPLLPAYGDIIRKALLHFEPCMERSTSSVNIEIYIRWPKDGASADSRPETGTNDNADGGLANNSSILQLSAYQVNVEGRRIP